MEYDNFPGISTRAYISVNASMNDLEEGITSRILKFADDTKLFF